ncbi:MAG: TonB-dependent receptor plug domain-containing protein, partial [Bacteroidota bacterium]
LETAVLQFQRESRRIAVYPSDMTPAVILPPSMDDRGEAREALLALTQAQAQAEPWADLDLLIDATWTPANLKELAAELSEKEVDLTIDSWLTKPSGNLNYLEGSIALPNGSNASFSGFLGKISVTYQEGRGLEVIVDERRHDEDEIEVLENMRAFGQAMMASDPEEPGEFLDLVIDGSWTMERLEAMAPELEARGIKIDVKVHQSNPQGAIEAMGGFISVPGASQQLFALKMGSLTLTGSEEKGYKLEVKPGKEPGDVDLLIDRSWTYNQLVLASGECLADGMLFIPDDVTLEDGKLTGFKGDVFFPGGMSASTFSTDNLGQVIIKSWVDRPKGKNYFVRVIDFQEEEGVEEKAVQEEVEVEAETELVESEVVKVEETPVVEGFRIRPSKDNLEPLFIIDGKPVDQTEIKFLKPADIEHVKVLKGKAATTKYGKNAAHGVIEIKTKRSVRLIDKLKLKVDPQPNQAEEILIPGETVAEVVGETLSKDLVEVGDELELNVSPNPSQDVFAIDFQLPEAQSLKLEIYDLQGRLVHTVFEGYKEIGNHMYFWEGGEQPAGSYLFKLQGESVFGYSKIQLLD